MAMFINGCPCAYRDFGHCIVVFSNAKHSHFILQDIYAEFFRAYYVKGLSKEFIINLIAQDYGVSVDIVSKDFSSFLQEIHLSCSIHNQQEKTLVELNSLSDNDIYSMMASVLIPFSATIEITDTCNLKCIHCYRNIPKKSYWNIDTFTKVLSELKALGTLHITLTGGEPFMHPNYIDFLQIVNQYNFVLTLQTNATFNIFSILSQLKCMPLKNIAISLYSTSPQTHDAITRETGSCVRTLNTIDTLLQNGIPITINCPVMQVNRNDMKLVSEFASSRKVTCNFSFKIIPSQCSPKATQWLNCFTEDFLYNCMIDPDIKLYNETLPNIRKSTVGDRYCQTGFRSITIDAQGHVIFCNAFRKCCGDVARSPIKEIWLYSKELQEWRNRVSIINNKCKKCQAYAYCEPCPAHYYTLSGKTDSIDSLTCAFGMSLFHADERVLSSQEGGEKNERI